MAFRIAVIGCGYITAERHGPAYRRYADEHAGVELAACCDRDLGRAETVAARFGFQKVYADFRKMLSAERLDAVCLNVPVELTAGLSGEILKAGLPLLSEKPPALTTAEIDRLIRTAEATGTLHQVAFNRRFSPLVRELKSWLQAEPILHVEHTFTRVSRQDPDFTTTAIHGIDTLRALTGQDFSSLRFQYLSVPTGEQPATCFIADGQLSGGASLHMLFQPISGASVERTALYTDGNTFELFLNQGADAPGRIVQWRGGRPVRAMDGPDLAGAAEDFLIDGFYAEDAAFFDAVRAGERPVDNFASARQSVEVMEFMRARKSRYP